MSTGSLSDEAMQYFKAKNIQFILDEALHNVVQTMPDDPLAFLEDAFRKSTPLRIILLGTPGSGKSTLAARVAQRYGVTRVTASTEAGKDDAAVASEVLAKITELHRSGQGWVLDGFPETRADTIQLQRCGVSPQRVFALNAPLNVTLRRMRADNASAVTQASEDAILQRFRFYEMRKAEVAGAYRSCLVEVPADGTADEVAEVVAKSIDSINLV